MRSDSDSGLFGTATRAGREARHEKPARGQVHEYLGALADTYGLPAGLVRAVAQTESNFDTGHTRAKRGASRDVFGPENTDYGLMQVRDDQIGQTVPAPDGSAHMIGNDIKTNWRANARAGVALLAQQYQLATLENPFGSEREHAQQAYAGYSGGASYRDRYLQTLSNGNQPAHPDDRSFLKNFLHPRAHGEHQDQIQMDSMHDLLYRYSDPQGHLETMPVRPRRQGEQDDLLLLSAAPDETQGTAAKSNASPLPAPLQRLKEDPRNLFGLNRSAETVLSPDRNVNSAQAPKGTHSSTSSRMASLANILVPLSRQSNQEATLPQPLTQLERNPGDLLLRPLIYSFSPEAENAIEEALKTHGRSYKQAFGSALNPADLKDAFRQAAKGTGLDVNLLVGLAKRESDLNPAVPPNPVGAKGLYQLRPPRQQDLGIADADINKYEIQIPKVAAEVRKAVDRYHGNIDLAIASWALGDRKLQSHLSQQALATGNPSPPEMQKVRNLLLYANQPNGPRLGPDYIDFVKQYMQRLGSRE